MKIGNKEANKPVSCVEVVEAMIIDFSCAAAGPAENAAKPRTVIKASAAFRRESKSGPR